MTKPKKIGTTGTTVRQGRLIKDFVREEEIYQPFLKLAQET